MKTPNLKQAEFLYACRADQGHQVINFYGGAGGGKTKGITDLAVDLAVQVPGNRVGVFRKVRADHDATTYAELVKNLDFNLLLAESREDYSFTLRTFNPEYPSYIEFLGLDKLSRMGGRFFGHIIIDETPELTLREFIYLFTRLRHELPNYERPPQSVYFLPNGELHRFIATAANPPESRDHWYDSLVWDSVIEDEKIDSYSVVVSTFDNEKNLPKSYITSLRSLPKYEFERMALGKRSRGHSGKPATPNFNYNEHVIDEPYPTNVAWFGGMDFGWAHPYACWITTTDGVVTIWDELMGRAVDLQKFLEELRKKQRFVPSVSKVKWWVDNSHGRQHNDKSKHTSIQICQNNGMFVVHEFSKPDHRAQGMNELARQGRLKVHRRCTQAIAMLSGGLGRDPDTGDVIKDGYYEHIGDGCGYVIWGEMKNDIKGFISRRKKARVEDTYTIKKYLQTGGRTIATNRG